MMNIKPKSPSVQPSNDTRLMDPTRQSNPQSSDPGTAHKGTIWNTTGRPVRRTTLPHSARVPSPRIAPESEKISLTESQSAQPRQLVHQQKASVGHDRPSATADETKLRILPNGDA